MKVLVAPDSFGGTLTPSAAAEAIAAGWRAARPDDDLLLAPMSDGGEGLLDALLHGAGVLPGAEVRELEVVGPRGLATTARWLFQPTSLIAVVEVAEACGLALLDPDDRDPLRTTSWGVGQLLAAARDAGATEILVGCGGTATVDGGTGACSALGFRLTVADGSGLKIGGQDLPRVAGIARTWVEEGWDEVDVQLLVDVQDALAEAPARYGPQKGADEGGVVHLEEGLRAWRAVCERDLGASPDLAAEPGTGAAGGLPYGLAAALGARIVPGAPTVAALLGWDEHAADVDLVVTGEGRLDATSPGGKVVSFVLRESPGLPVALVVGQLDGAPPQSASDVEVAAADGPGEDPAAEVAAAAERLAGRWEQGS